MKGSDVRLRILRRYSKFFVFLSDYLLALPLVLVFCLSLLILIGYTDAKGIASFVNTFQAKQKLESRRYVDAWQHLTYVYPQGEELVDVLVAGQTDSSLRELSFDEILKKLPKWLGNSYRYEMAFVTSIAQIYKKGGVAGSIEQKLVSLKNRLQEIYPQLAWHISDPQADAHFLLAARVYRKMTTGHLERKKNDLQYGVKECMLALSSYLEIKADSRENVDRLQEKINFCSVMLEEFSRRMTSVEWSQLGQCDDLRNMGKRDDAILQLASNEQQYFKEGLSQKKKGGSFFPSLMGFEGGSVSKNCPQPPSWKNLNLIKRANGQRDFTEDFFRDLISGVWIYISLGSVVVFLILLCVCLVPLYLNFKFKNAHPALREVIKMSSRIPNLLTECLPQIFWLFLVSRFIVISTNIWTYTAWLTIIAFTYSPVAIEQFETKIKELRSSRFVDAETVAGKKERTIFWRDIFWRHLLPVFVVQFIFMLSSIVLMEGCMAFLSHVHGGVPSLASLLAQNFTIGTASFGNVNGFVSALSAPFIVVLILMLSMIVTFRNIASRFEEYLG